MKFSTKITTAIIILIALLAISIGVNKRAPESNTIKIGMIYSLTGPASVWAENGKHAAEMAADEINAAGGVSGKRIQLIFVDSGSNPKSSVSAFHKLVDIDGVRMIIGDMWSVTTNPLIPLADSNKVLLVSPTVMSASVESQSPYFFTVGHTVESQESSIKTFFSLHPQVKTVYNLCWNDAWGNAHSALIRKITAELNLILIGETCTSDYSSDYRTEAAKIKAAKPDAVFLTGAFEEVAIKSLTDIGVTSKILTTTGIVEAVKVHNFPVEYTKNVWFMYWSPNEEFTHKFQNKFGSYPIMEAQNHYEAVYSIVRALKNNLGNTVEGIKSVVYDSSDGKIDFTGASQITVNKAEARLYQFDSGRNFVESK